MTRRWHFSPLLLVLSGGAIMGLALGIRHVQGLFLLPLTTAHAWTRADFAFALALQNLVWGIAQPFTGMVADRFGSRRVIFAGCLLYGAGLYAMARATTPGEFALSAGLVIGVALSCTSFGAIYGALSRMLPPERRAWGLALAGAAGGLGQFVSVPAAQNALAALGAQGALVLLAVAISCLCVFALPLHDAPPVGGAVSAAADPRPNAPQSMRATLRAAAGHRDLWMLGIGFLACGFQLAFIATHLPAYLLDKGLDGRSAMAALAIIAMANVAGTYVCGLLGAKLSKPKLLAGLYLVRSAAIALFVLVPLSEATLYAFAFVMGLLWLGTVPLTTGIVSRIFGVQYLSTLFGFVFLGHQIGSFLGVWLGGVMFDATQSYDAVWLCAIAVGIGAAALHWPIREQPAPIMLRAQMA
ncbi:MFS transporter [Zemynaea arenosa]|nr:MFS transporter [Massilia arenosa]